MSTEKYLSKIKKLLNLAKRSSNASEAANAMSQAQNLMAKYNLTTTDVELTDITEASSKGAPSEANTPPRYMSYLATVICSAFGVQCYWSYRYAGKYGIPKRIAAFYGVNESPEIAAYAFDVLSRQLKKARQEFIATQRKSIKAATKVARADQFCEGWVKGAYALITPLIIAESEKTLMAAYDAKITKENNMQECTSREAKKCRGDSNAAYEGYRAGLNAQLHTAVNGSNPDVAQLGDSL